MTIGYSKVHDLKSRWAPDNFRTSLIDPKAWYVMQHDFRRMWEIEELTILETPFYELFSERGNDTSEDASHSK